MLDLRDERGLTYLFITHDLSLAWVIADRIAVMYLGKIMEIGAAERSSGGRGNPYTQALVRVLPTPEPPASAGARSARSSPARRPSAARVPPGCRFHPRCPLADRPDLEVPHGGAAALRRGRRPRGGLLACRGRAPLPVLGPSPAGG